MQSALWVQYLWSGSMVGGCSLLSLGASLWLGTGLTLGLYWYRWRFIFYYWTHLLPGQWQMEKHREVIDA